MKLARSPPAICRSTSSTGVFGSERLPGALLDRLPHHVDILEMIGNNSRLKHCRRRQRQLRRRAFDDQPQDCYRDRERSLAGAYGSVP